MTEQTTVPLSTAITRGDTKVTSVAVSKPTVGALRGQKLTNVLQMDVNAMLSILPRCTQPALLPDEVANLDPVDFLSLAGAVVGFFMSPADRAAAEAELRLN